MLKSRCLLDCVALGSLLITCLLAGCSSDAEIPEAQQDGTIISNRILTRELVASQSEVRHVLIGWKDLAAAYGEGFDRRAASRDEKEAKEFVLRLLARARDGANFRQLMKEHSEDPTTASSGGTYVVSLTSPLGPEFTKMGMRLYLGEVGVAKSPYGYHIIKRVQ